MGCESTVSIPCHIDDCRRFWLIRKVDHVSSLYVNVHRYLRVLLRLVAGDREQMHCHVFLHVFGRRLVEQSEECCRCWDLRLRECDTCLLLDIRYDVTFLHCAGKAFAGEFCALSCVFLGFAFAGEHEFHGVTDAGRYFARFGWFRLDLRRLLIDLR